MKVWLASARTGCGAPHRKHPVTAVVLCALGHGSGVYLFLPPVKPEAHHGGRLPTGRSALFHSRFKNTRALYANDGSGRRDRLSTAPGRVSCLGGSSDSYAEKRERGQHHNNNCRPTRPSGRGAEGRARRSFIAPVSRHRRTPRAPFVRSSQGGVCLFVRGIQALRYGRPGARMI